MLERTNIEDVFFNTNPEVPMFVVDLAFRKANCVGIFFRKKTWLFRHVLFNFWMLMDMGWCLPLPQALMIRELQSSYAWVRYLFRLEGKMSVATESKVWAILQQAGNDWDVCKSQSCHGIVGWFQIARYQTKCENCIIFFTSCLQNPPSISWSLTFSGY